MSSEKPILVSYMPYWHSAPGETRPWRKDPWGVLKAQFPEREPIQSWYDESKQEVMDIAMAQAVSGGIDCFSFDTYHNPATRRFIGDVAMRNFMKSSVKGMSFCMALSTDNIEMTQAQLTLRDWHDIWDQFAEISDHPGYQKIKGRPVAPIIKFYDLEKNITAATGKSHRELLDIARKRSGKNIYFVAGMEATDHWLWRAQDSGYDAFSMYNMSSVVFPAGVRQPRPTSYAELVAGYEATWDYMLQKSKIDLLLMMTTGWDSRSLQNGILIGEGMPDELHRHFTAAKTRIDANPKVAGGWLYSWNEHAESPPLEPTKLWGREKLGIFRNIFG